MYQPTAETLPYVRDAQPDSEQQAILAAAAAANAASAPVVAVVPVAAAVPATNWTMLIVVGVAAYLLMKD